MSTSLAASLSEFATSLSGIAISLFNAVLAVFHSIFSLAQNIVGNAMALGNSLVKLTLGVFQGVFGFLAGTIQSPVYAGKRRFINDGFNSQFYRYSHTRRRVLSVHQEVSERTEEESEGKVVATESKQGQFWIIKCLPSLN
jgi:hypothetical protein